MLLNIGLKQSFIQAINQNDSSHTRRQNITKKNNDGWSVNPSPGSKTQRTNKIKNRKK